MRTLSRLTAAAAIVAVALVPRPAAAQASACGAVGYTFSLGLGGSLAGCFTGLISELGENAGAVSSQYFWAGNFLGRTGVTNAPTLAGTFMFDNDCGGGTFFAFCNGVFVKAPVLIANTSGELVVGLSVPDNTYGNGTQWVYSGSSLRGDTPMPSGFQSVLLQLTIGGVDDPGQFLFGWEDLNSGCMHRVATASDRFREEDLTNAALLNTTLADCDVILAGGNSDSDFNDSYMKFSISGTGVLLDLVPEPFTMSLMAIGLVAMGGVSLRRPKK